MGFCLHTLWIVTSHSQHCRGCCCCCCCVVQFIWPGLFARHGGRLQYDFDLSTLAHLSEGYAAGDLDAVVAGLMTPARRERLKMRPVDIPEVLQWLCRVRVRC